MRLRRTERRVLRAVAPVAVLAAMLTTYYLHGPFGTRPVVVHTSLTTISGAAGVYMRGLPDFVFVNTEDPIVLAHETLHYLHPSWTECQVSATLASQGIHDYYYLTRKC